MGSGFQHPLFHTRHLGLLYKCQPIQSVREDGFAAERSNMVAPALVVVVDHPYDAEAWDYSADRET